jgi:hypothetical protein
VRPALAFLASNPLSLRVGSHTAAISKKKILSGTRGIMVNTALDSLDLSSGGRAAADAGDRIACVGGTAVTFGSWYRARERRSLPEVTQGSQRASKDKTY